MKYHQTIRLKDGRECILRSAAAEDAQAVLDCFILTHEQTDMLFSYPEEISLTLDKETQYLQKRA